MRFLFVSTYYPNFLKALYARESTVLQELSYVAHQRRLLDELFGDADFYSLGMRANGQEAEDVIMNDENLQKKWASEHGLNELARPDFLPRSRFVSLFYQPHWITAIVQAQIESYQPDVIYFQDIEFVSPHFLRSLRRQKKIIVAQKASPVRRIACFREADIVFTSFPHFVPWFQARGVKAFYLPLAFGERILTVVPRQEKKYNCTFIGGFSRHHRHGIKLLAEVAEQVDIDLLGYGKNFLPHNSNAYQRHHGEVWGKDMYRIMMQSRLTINRHIDVAEEYANNMRLFEATGSGALLITDVKKNLSELFEIGKEIIAYTDKEDLIQKIKYYTAHPDEAEQIAAAGQRRTLRDHNFTVRMKEIVEMIKRAGFQK